MHIVFTPHILPFVAAALVLAGLLTVAWTNRRDPVARWFGATLVALIIWQVGYAFEIVVERLDDKILFANLQYLGVATVSVCWYEMVRRYLGLKKVPRVIGAFLWLVAAATVAIAFLNPAGLFRAHPFIAGSSAPFPLLNADYGPWYTYVLVPVTALLNVGVLVLLGRGILRSKRFYRMQYALLFVSLFLPLVGTVLYVFDLIPWSNYNPTAAIAGFSGLVMAVGLFRWRLFDIVPLARDFVVEDLEDAVIVADGAGRIVDLNLSAERLTGVGRDAVIGRPAEEALARYPVLVELLTAPDDGSAHMVGPREMVVVTEGVNRYYGLSSSRVTRRRGDFLGRTVVLHEVTERVRLLEQARELARTDDLTQLANRRHFLEVTEREFERACRYHYSVSFILLDIDHFKEVNDTHGHRAGDLVLRELAAMFQATTRSTDTVGRFGGEEFGVLLPHSDLEGATKVADRLRLGVESMRVDLGTGGEEVGITLSMGVTQFRSGPSELPDTVDAVLERADKALYQAKRLGRNMVVASEEDSMPATPGAPGTPRAPALRAVV